MPYGTVNADVIQSSVSGVSLGAGNASSLKNRIINGAMVIDQRYAGTATANTISGYTIDRWQVYQSTTGKVIAQQNAGSVTPPVGFNNYLGITSQSAYSVSSTDQFLITQVIEAFNTADLGFGTASAKTVTLSFQVYSSLTGTFGGSIQNNAQNRCYPFSYSIPVANTWTQISVTIPGDTSGTWVGATNGRGIILNISLATGSTYSGTAGAWTGSSFISSATGATSVVGTNGATFYITGVQLEVGSSATGFEYRQYGTELGLCQRYYQTGTSKSIKQNCDILRTSYDPVNFPMTMRAAPTLTNTNTGSVNVTVAAVANPYVNGFSFQWQSSTTVDYQNVFNWTASAEL